MTEKDIITKAGAKIIRYGERGVVDTIVHSCVQKGQTKQFLELIKWGDGASQNWIQNVESVAWIVEVGLSRTGFGDPDLILVCKTSKGDSYFVFIEAKVIQYNKSAMSNRESMEKDHFNSSINGQLALKYRFVQACANWKGESPEIEEPHLIHQQYREKMKDKSEDPRKLAKKEIIENILLKNGFDEANLENSFFVAMTWDAEPGPFVDIDKDIRPRFYDKTGVDDWETIEPQVGWIGYGTLARELNLGKEFEATLRMMVGKYPEPTTIEFLLGASIDPINWSNYSTKTRVICDKILDLFKEIEPKCTLLQQEGSHSIKYRTVKAKIIPYKKGRVEVILLGFSTTINPTTTNKHELKGPYLVIRQPFLFTEIIPKNWQKQKNSIRELITQNPLYSRS